MNWVDFVIILIAFIFALDGLKQGFFKQIFNIIGFLISLLTSLIFYSPTSSLLINLFHLPAIAANPVGFLIVWIIAECIATAILAAVFTKIKPVVANGYLDKLLGFIPAIGSALLFCSFILLFVVSLPIRADIKTDVYASRIGASLVSKVSVIEDPLNKVFGPITKQGLTFLTIKPEDTGSINLQFTQDKVTNDYKSEQAMFKLVNEERAKVGVKPLIWDKARANVARGHSQDMFNRGYFSHYSPEGKDVGDRLQEASINYNVAGENLALAPTLQRAHEGLMNSPGHKRNILDPAFAKVGIGVIDGGVYGKMFTQVFTD